MTEALGHGLLVFADGHSEPAWLCEKHLEEAEERVASDPLVADLSFISARPGAPKEDCDICKRTPFTARGT